MAAYGAATSLKNTIQRILQSSRVSLVPPPPKISQFAGSCFAVFDNSYFKGVIAAFVAAVSLKNPQISHVMAAYVGAIYLKRKIQGILRPSPSAQILQPAYEAMCHLQKVLLKLEDTGYSKIRTKVNALDERIKEIIWEFKDLLESHLSDQILTQLESSQ